jgi:hypothetical protein
MKRAFTASFLIMFLLSFQISNAQGWIWTKGAVGTSTCLANDICVDNLGNIYTTGQFYGGQLILGTSTLVPTPSGTDAFIAMHDNNGNVQWSLRIPKCKGRSITLDPSGNIIFAGAFTSTLVLGSTTLAADPSGSDDYLIAKFDPGGNPIWVKSFGGQGNDIPYSVKADGSGNVYVTGTVFSQSIVIGSTTYTVPTSSSAAPLVKYDPNGNLQWSRMWKAANTNGNGVLAFCMDINNSNNQIVVAGQFSGDAIAFGTNTLVNGGAFFVKCSSSGTELFAAQTSSTANWSGVSIKQSNGDIYLVGYAQGTVTAGSFSVASTPYYQADAIFAKYSNSGTVQWLKQIVGSSSDYGTSIKTHSAGAYLSGTSSSSLFTIGSQTYSYTNYYYKGFVANIDQNGNPFCSADAITNAGGLLLALDQNSNAYLAGYNQLSPLVLGTNTITPSHTSGQYFLAKYKCTQVGIEENNHNELIISLFPNPFRERVTINYEEERPHELEVINALGQSVLIQKLNASETEIDLKDHESGLYIFTIKQENRVLKAYKLIKQ